MWAVLFCYHNRMRSDKRSLTVAVVFAAALSVSAFAASGRYAAPHGDVVKIWPDGKMPVVSTNQTYVPFMEFFKPEKATTDAFLLVTPGGGYGGVAYDGEGYPVQRF